MSILEWIVLSAAAASGLGYFANKFFKLFKTWFQFIQDWNGTEDKPGVVDRLEIGSKKFEILEKEVQIIKAELFNNHGTSLRDAIDRIEKNTSK
jgi:hypothetical protein